MDKDALHELDVILKSELMFGLAPVEKVLVRLQDTGKVVTTDDRGHFELTDVSPGVHELYVSAVDFILVRTQ